MTGWRYELKIDFARDPTPEPRRNHQRSALPRRGNSRNR